MNFSLSYLLLLLLFNTYILFTHSFVNESTHSVMSLHFFENFDSSDSVSYLKFHFKTSSECQVASDGFVTFGFQGICRNDEEGFVKAFCDLNCSNCLLLANFTLGDRLQSDEVSTKLGVLPINENGLGTTFIIEGFCANNFPTIPLSHQMVLSSDCSNSSLTSAIMEFFPSSCYIYRVSSSSSKLQYFQRPCASGGVPQLRNCSTARCERCTEPQMRRSSCLSNSSAVCSVPTISVPTISPQFVDPHQVLDWVGAVIGTLIVLSIAIVSCVLYFRKKQNSENSQELAKYVKIAEDYDD